MVFCADDGLNESQPPSAVPDFELCGATDVFTADEAASEGTALLSALDEAAQSLCDENWDW
jgi:hypothetical protein